MKTYIFKLKKIEKLEIKDGEIRIELKEEENKEEENKEDLHWSNI